MKCNYASSFSSSSSSSSPSTTSFYFFVGWKVEEEPTEEEIAFSHTWCGRDKTANLLLWWQPPTPSTTLPNTSTTRKARACTMTPFYVCFPFPPLFFLHCVSVSSHMYRISLPSLAECIQILFHLIDQTHHLNRYKIQKIWLDQNHID